MEIVFPQAKTDLTVRPVQAHPPLTSPSQTFQRGVNPAQNVLQFLVVVLERRTNVSLEVIVLDYTELFHSSGPTGTIFIHSNVNIGGVASLDIVHPLRQVIVKRHFKSANSGLIVQELKLRANLLLADAAKIPITIPDANKRPPNSPLFLTLLTGSDLFVDGIKIDSCDWCCH